MRVAAAVLVASVLAIANAGATPLAINTELTADGVGLGVSTAGVGLSDFHAGGGSATLIAGVPDNVEHAFLYWSGRTLHCSLNADNECEVPFEPYLDQELVFDGTPITGTIIGTEGQAPPQPYLALGYRADVTAQVLAAGSGAAVPFSIGDGNAALDLTLFDGAALLILYHDDADSTAYRVQVYEGLDFAYGRDDQLPAAQVTEPVVFDHGATGEDRTGRLIVFAGDAEEERPDRIDVTDAFGNETEFVNQLVGSVGEELDLFERDVDVPAGGDTTTVQLFSEPVGENPDSLLWQLGVLRVPMPGEPLACRVTGGGHDIFGGDGGADTSEAYQLNLAVGPAAGPVEIARSGSVSRRTRGPVFSHNNGNLHGPGHGQGNGDDVVSEGVNGLGNRYTFGGQAGAPGGSQPQPYGEWTHHQQSGPSGRFVFHAGTHSAPDDTEVDRITCSDPGFCDPARHAPAKQIDFEGVGSFRNIASSDPLLAGVAARLTRHWFEVHIEDLGEPGSHGLPGGDACPVEGSAGQEASCACPDFYRITIYAAFDPDSEAPNRDDVIYEVYGYVDGGNLQIHPPLD